MNRKKYKKMAKMRVAIDLDKTILRANFNQWIEKGMNYFGTPTPGVKSFLKQLKKLGYYIIIHTVRTNNEVNFGYTNEQLAEKISRALKERDILFDEIWIDRGKPAAEYYIDDKAIRYERNWTDILLKYFWK